MKFYKSIFLILFTLAAVKIEPSNAFAVGVVLTASILITFFLSNIILKLTRKLEIVELESNDLTKKDDSSDSEPVRSVYDIEAKFRVSAFPDIKDKFGTF